MTTYPYSVEFALQLIRKADRIFFRLYQENDSNQAFLPWPHTVSGTCVLCYPSASGLAQPSGWFTLFEFQPKKKKSHVFLLPFHCASHHTPALAAIFLNNCCLSWLMLRVWQNTTGVQDMASTMPSPPQESLQWFLELVMVFHFRETSESRNLPCVEDALRWSSHSAAPVYSLFHPRWVTTPKKSLGWLIPRKKSWYMLFWSHSE